MCACRALASDHATVRARSFDIIYNLAVHAELLSTNEAANVAEQIEVNLPESTQFDAAGLQSELCLDTARHHYNIARTTNDVNCQCSKAPPLPLLAVTCRQDNDVHSRQSAFRSMLPITAN